MNLIKRYTEYLKNNPKGYWFRRKLYGWGWTPATWQGWIVIVLFLLFLIWNSMALTPTAEQQPTASELNWFFGKLVAAVIVLIAICYKTGEPPRWQWGLPEKRPEETQPPK